MESLRKLLTVFAVVLTLAAFGGVTAMVTLSLAQAQEAIVDESGIRARYDGRHLSVTIPFSRKTSGILRGKISCALLDLDDNIIGRAERSVVLRLRNDSVTLDLPGEMKAEDLATTRIRYSYVHDGGEISGIVAAQSVIDWLEVRVLGQNRLYSGSTTSLRIIALNHRNSEPVSEALVTLTLSLHDREIPLYTGKTDREGTMEALAQIPNTPQEEAKLTILVTSPIGEQTIEKQVKLVEVSQTYLITDKPIYQPNQTIHIRTLTLAKPDLLPLKNREATIQILDSKGNKVFKKRIRTDQFGVAAAQFRLADEINKGRYKVQVLIDDEKTEKTITVERYVLPKFNVTLKTDREYYLPGETLKGTVRAAYFFGKPVSGGRVKVRLSKFDVGFTEAGEALGRTDKEGNFEFEMGLPDHFVGQPLEQGNAFVKLDVEVTDEAQHKEEKSLTRIVAKNIIKITLIPESGEVVPRVRNRIYCMTTYPDGRPAITRITLNQMEAETDSSGVATFEILPQEEEGLIMNVAARDERGNEGILKSEFSYDFDAVHLLLRTDRAIYRVGERMDLTVLASKKNGTVYVDMIKDGQTMLTKSMRVKGGSTEASIGVTQNLAGTVKVHAYLINTGGDIVRDTRTIFVNPANDLVIGITPDRKSYRPGDDGTIDFVVTDGQGKPVVSAIGVAIVDEAVFALTEMQPGMEKVYFTLEKEIMTPRYEIHDFTPQQIVLPIEHDARRQRAATILLASLKEYPDYSIDVNTYKEIEEKALQRIFEKMLEDLEKLRKSVGQYRNEKRRYPSKSEGLKPVVQAGYLKENDLLDPWGTPYEIVARRDDLSWFDIMSYGPDKRKGTSDDITPSYFARKGWGGRFARGAEKVLAPGIMFDEMDAALPIEEAELAAEPVATSAVGVKQAEPRIRRYFPETMLFEPRLITNRKGRASLSLKWADSITEWRLTSTASSATGQLGSKTSGIKVFQDFFVDLDLPVSLTQGDEVSIPVAIYNYLKASQEVKLVLSGADWFDLLSDGTVTRSLEKDEVSVVYFRIKVIGIGLHSLTVKAYGSEMSDAISREIEVIPDGELVLTSVSDRLEGKVEKTVSIPERAVDGASKVLVKIFPGIFSQIVDGLEQMLRMPFGCFEQTSSVTYPNILTLDYMRKTDQATPENEMKAEGFISIGYQRLLSFEVEGGGFEWFGNAPANKLLTAYGLMEFNDMSKVYEIDENIIERTQRWLLESQEKNGSWKPDASYLHAESWSRIQKNELLPTAYVSWALLEAGERSEQVSRAIGFVKENVAGVKDPYMLSLCANALAAWDKNDPITERVFETLRELAIEEKGAVFWKSEIPTFTHSHGSGADMETTSLVAYALVKYGKMQNLTNKALTYLIRSKDASGTWGGTQATTMALRALLASLGGSTEDVDANVSIRVNGRKAETLRLTEENADVMRLVDLAQFTGEGANDVSVELTGKGSCLYEIVGKYYMPWEYTIQPPKELLSIQVDYDKTELSQNDLVTCRVKVANNRPGTAHMVMVDLGIPPGFEVQAGDLAELVDQKIQKFTLTARQVIIYLEKLESKRPLEFSYRLKAKFPLRAKTVQSRVYEYYNPEIEAISPPVEMVVK